MVPTVASPNIDSHQVERTMTGMDEAKSKILMRVAVRLNRSLCSTQEGLNEALNRQMRERGSSDWKGNLASLIAEKNMQYCMSLQQLYVSVCVSRREVLQDKTKYCSSDLRSSQPLGFEIDLSEHRLFSF